MRNVCILMVMFALTSCAANVVRLEHTGEVSTKAKAVTEAVDAYVVDVQARRRAANVALVASDPSCTWGDEIVVDTMWDGKRGLCDVDGLPQARRLSMPLRPISAAAIRPVAQAVAGIATFQAALAAVLDAKPVDAKAEIDGAIGTLSTAATDLNRIAGGKVIDLGPLTGDTGKAVVGLVGALIEIQQTELKVRKVDAIVRRTDTARLYSNLSSAVTRLDRLQGRTSTANLRDALDRVYARDAERMDFVQRRELVRQIAEARDVAEETDALRLKTLTDAIKELADSDVKLRRALNGDFPPEERRRIAKENRAQALALLSKIAAVFPAA